MGLLVSNLTSSKNDYIYVKRKPNAKVIGMSSWAGAEKYPWAKYLIKESDMRTKTASFKTNAHFDLTTGVYCVLIVSDSHEPFAGEIIDIDYDRKTGLYEYQCQDFSRDYMGKFELIIPTNDLRSYYRILQFLLTRGGIPLTSKSVKKAKLKEWSFELSGLKPKAYYNQGYYDGNGINFNPMDYKQQMIIRDKSYIEAIRDLVFGSGAYIDLYFNRKGVLQIKPYSKNDWLTNGLYITTQELAEEKFSFDITNVITSVIVNGNEHSGALYSSESLSGLDLTAFFGQLGSSVSGSNDSTKIATSSSSSGSKTSNTSGNPYGTKKKEVTIDADGGFSKSFLNNVADKLRKHGWKVNVKGIGPGQHSINYKNVKNGVYMPFYNGLCAGTIWEMGLNYYGGLIKKNGSVLAPAWYTNSWTSSSMKKYRNDITGIKSLKRAWDDNFSSIKSLSNPAKYMTNHKVMYSVGDTVDKIVSQFLAGGFDKYKSKKSTSSKKTNSNSNNKGVINSTLANNIANDKANALAKMQESWSNVLSLKITLPLHPNLKHLHTNMFVYTELPEEFSLANMGVLSEALNSTYSRFTGYQLDRWYVQGITIDNDGKNRKMTVDLNPFASSLVKYKDYRLKYVSAYDSAKKNTNSNSNSNSNSKNTSVTGGQGKTIDNLVKSIIGNVTDELRKAKLIHEWLRKNVRYPTKGYECSRYKTPEACYKNRSHLNCADTARLTCAMMLSAGLKAYIVHRTTNGGHFWTIIEIGGKKYASDQTGNGSAWNTVWKKSGRTTVSNGGSYTRKNGSKPDC